MIEALDSDGPPAPLAAVDRAEPPAAQDLRRREPSVPPASSANDAVLASPDSARDSAPASPAPASCRARSRS